MPIVCVKVLEQLYHTLPSLLGICLVIIISRLEQDFASLCDVLYRNFAINILLYFKVAWMVHHIHLHIHKFKSILNRASKVSFFGSEEWGRVRVSE